GSFFEEIERIGRPEYVPSEMDILKARAVTKGITELVFKSGILTIHMMDVGGQRAERKKWIHCFQNATTVIFCVALSEYDQFLIEESGQNRLMESFQLFEYFVNSQWFFNSSIVLFLNKTDIFRKKLQHSPLSRYFPDYTGGPDFEKAAEYI